MISPAAGLVVPMAHEGRTRPCTARLAFGGAMKFLFDLGYSCPRHTSSCEYGANSLIIQNMGSLSPNCSRSYKTTVLGHFFFP